MITQRYQEFILFGLATCLAVVLIATVILMIVIRYRSVKSKKNSLFGSVEKMPPTHYHASIFPIGLYKSSDNSSEYCSASDLSNMEAHQDAGLASYKPTLPQLRYEMDNTGGTVPTATVIGRGVHKWAVHFKLKYDVTLERLEVGILHASTIAVTNGASSSFLFFNIYLMPDESEHKQSQLRPRQSTTINFDETFNFRLKHADASSRTLRLSLYTMDGDRTRTCLGHVAQALCGLGIFDGQVHFFTHDLGTLEAVNMEGCLGEALVSMCYHMHKEKLKVRLVDARNLPSQINADSKFYLRTSIIIGDRVAKTKKTPARDDVRDLFVNCAYAFLVPCKHLDVCAFVFSIIEVVKYNEGQLVKERPWGRFTIGPCSFARGAGVDHWKLMLANSKKTIEMWHVIVAETN